MSDDTNSAAGTAQEAYAGDMETTAATEVTTPETTELEAKARSLTLHDRCDRCHAEALGYAEKDDLDMLFCGHHLTKFEDALAEQGFTVYRVKTAE